MDNMTDDVQFDIDNNQIYTNNEKPSGVIEWLLQKGIFKSKRQALVFVLMLSVLAILLSAVLFFQSRSVAPENPSPDLINSPQPVRPIK